MDEDDYVEDDIGTYADLLQRGPVGYSDQELDEAIIRVGRIKNKNKPRHLREERNRRAQERARIALEKTNERLFWLSLVATAATLASVFIAVLD